MGKDEKKTYEELIAEGEIGLKTVLQVDTLEGDDVVSERIGKYLSFFEHRVVELLRLCFCHMEEFDEVPELLKALAVTLGLIGDHVGFMMAQRVNATCTYNILMSGGYRGMLLHLTESLESIEANLKAERDGQSRVAKAMHAATTAVLPSMDPEKSVVEVNVRQDAVVLECLEGKLALARLLWCKRGDRDGESPVDALLATMPCGTDATYRPFRRLTDMHDEDGTRMLGEIFATWHFGYLHDLSLQLFAPTIKAIFCAVDNLEKEGGWKSIWPTPDRGAFLRDTLKTFIDHDKRSRQYTDLRLAGMETNVLCGVWNLMEDSTVTVMATLVGVVPIPPALATKTKFMVPVNVGGKKSVECYFYHEKHLNITLRDEDDVPIRKLPRPVASIANRVAHVTSHVKERKRNEMTDSGNKVEPHGIRGHISHAATTVGTVAAGVGHATGSVVAAAGAHVAAAGEALSEVGGKAGDVAAAVGAKAADVMGVAGGAAVDATEELHKHRPKTLILHIHGGGFIAQSPTSHKMYTEKWAKNTKLPLLSIDYSLSPDARFPQAAKECYEVYKWLRVPENLEAIGLDPEAKIILAGDSAGGNLCLTVTIMAINDLKEGETVDILGLVLHYPVTNVALSGSVSRLIYENDPLLNLQSTKTVLESYLGGEPEELERGFHDHMISPFVTPPEILAKFPTTYLAGADVDPLLDDSTFLFARLQRAGARAVLRIAPMLPHGFLNVPRQLPTAAPGATDAGSDFITFLHEGRDVAGEVFASNH